MFQIFLSATLKQAPRFLDYFILYILIGFTDKLANLKLCTKQISKDITFKLANCFSVSLCLS